MRCLIVDDEPLAQQILEKYIHLLDDLTLVGKCNNAIQAISFMQLQQIDLLLLDIQMPELNGLEMLRQLHRPPKVILTTAFSEFALNAFDLDVVDYLLKPISFERFARAINKVRLIKTVPEQVRPETRQPFIFVRSDRKLHKIFLADILFVQGLSNYLKIYTEKQMLIVREKMLEIETLLPPDLFIRVHKSYIVALAQIKYAEGSTIVLHDHIIPIGESYRAAFWARINQQG